MKKFYILVCLTILCMAAKAQSYDVLNYNFNGTPAHGVNIKTNLPFLSGAQMITLKIDGYSYGTAEVISLNVVWYIYDDVFYSPSISSAGSYTPEVYLTNNNGLVNVFINDRNYYQRFKVTAFAQGMLEQSSWFQGWTTADEPMQGTHVRKIEYKNKFQGTVINSGDLHNYGDVGIGTANMPGYKLAVNGKVRAHEIKVETANWPDYVFAKDYELPTLQETEKHIKDKGHLQGIPSAVEVKANGVDLGEMIAKLLQKIEELTLHLIDMKKENDKERENNKAQHKEIEDLKSKLK